VDCNKEITLYHERCWSCSSRKNSWNRGLTKDNDSRIKRYSKQLSISRRGKNNPFFGKTHSNRQKDIWRKERILDKHPHWKGGKILHKGSDGGVYILIKKPNHPYANIHGYVLEHRLIMEKKLKRYLKPNELVHHRDGNTLNNSISNLSLFNSNGEHSHFHNLNKKRDDNGRFKKET
jgi:hypothetical protein